MEMFNPKVLKERIGHLKKSKNLEPLKEVEGYVLDKLKDLGIEPSYDVIAQEMPYFRTMGYTSYATCFLFQPLNVQFRSQQMRDAWDDQDHEIKDFASYFKDNVNQKLANKYQDRDQDTEKYPVREYLVVLPGSNKIKDKTCLNKLKHIHKTHGDKVWFKPHPITTHKVIGELKDIFGEDNILPRDIDMYHYLKFSLKIYTTHISESAMYGVALGKEIEPIDVMNGIEMGSFYSINRFLFEHQENGIEWINKTLSSPKSGIICPALDQNWKDTVDIYLEYTQKRRLKFESWFIDQNPKKNKK
jgi:hypothetical protein